MWLKILQASREGFSLRADDASQREGWHLSVIKQQVGMLCKGKPESDPEPPHEKLSPAPGPV